MARLIVSICSPLLASSIAVATIAGTLAARPLNAHIDFGVGTIHTQPFTVGGDVSGCVAIGLSMRLVGATRIGLDYQATQGTSPFFSTGIPERAKPGKQSLATVLLNLELVSSRRISGPFMSAGLGVGHSTISGARPFVGLVPFPVIELHDRTAAAFGLGAGFRSAGGPFGTRVQLAIRTHGLLLDALSSSCYSTAFTLGVTH